ncbi:MAG: hypothetical protein A2860_00580 [Candidatus Levybacteria bacterium RIFCSPHIGHO2_01_FULL_37_33]|nr:MAG: hypothetical protein A2860_00580 [Candidatus Levybacteria bacterium RIFCSPHIGHO2_01_FULL_37_33]
MKKETLRNILVAGAIIVTTATSIGASSPKESQDAAPLQIDDFDRSTITLFVAAEVLAVGLIGYRFSEGARKGEKQLWQYGLPATNFAAAGMLLGRIWGVV